MQVADLPNAEHIHREAFTYEAWSLVSLGQVLAMPASRGLIADDPSQEGSPPMGFALFTITGDEVELLTIAVDVRARRRGVATDLINALDSEAAAAGARELLLEVAADNLAGRRLYAKLGFRETGTRTGYYRRPGEQRADARLLKRTILPK